MNEDQKQPTEQQPPIDQLITQANTQAYVFEHSKQKRSFKQWFQNLPRTRKILWVGGGVFVVFVVIIACVTLGTSKNQIATKSSTTSTSTTSTAEDVVSTEGDVNGDRIIDENDLTTSTDTDAAATATGTSWWQKLLNIKNSSTVRTTSSTESSDKAKVASEDGSDDSFMNNYDTVQEEIDSSGVATVPADESGNTPVTASSFSIVAMPDTQREVQNDVRNGTSLFSDSMKWIIANKDKRLIKAVVHSGDIVHASASTGSSASTKMVNGFYETASKGFSQLDNAGIVYSIASGNHDTDAICSSNNGGSIWCNAETSAKTAQLLGKTTRFDKTYTANRDGLRGLTMYKSGRVQTSYRTFSSGSSKWLILTVEYLVPSDVFKWAQQAVASHSDYNVVLVVHRYMSGSASIMGSCEGSCTPAKTIFNNLVMKYPNVKIVVSGHAGYQAIRVDTSPAGNKVVEFQTTMHETTKNPLRLISVDPSKGTITSRLCLYTSKSSESSCTEKKISGMKFLN